MNDDLPEDYPIDEMIAAVGDAIAQGQSGVDVLFAALFVLDKTGGDISLPGDEKPTWTWNPDLASLRDRVEYRRSAIAQKRSVSDEPDVNGSEREGAVLHGND